MCDNFEEWFYYTKNICTECKKEENLIIKDKWYSYIHQKADNLNKEWWVNHIWKKCWKEYQKAIIDEFKKIAFDTNPENFYF